MKGIIQRAYTGCHILVLGRKEANRWAQLNLYLYHLFSVMSSNYVNLRRCGSTYS